MMKKVFILCFTALFCMQPVLAFDAPDMVEADISATSLNPYYISTKEVTQSLYLEITGKNTSACVPENAAYARMLSGELQENRPVESLTFFDAMQFCNLLTEETLGKEQCVYTLADPVYDNEGRIIRFGTVAADFTKGGYRLPTREEWQNAAGSEPGSLAMYAWYVDNSAVRGAGRTGFGTHAVAKKLPNMQGLYDMYGNVAEMCHEGETLNLCIMGTAWNWLTDVYTDGYSVDWLYGYSQYTVARNNIRESFEGYDTCGFRLCRSVVTVSAAVEEPLLQETVAEEIDAPETEVPSDEALTADEADREALEQTDASEEQALSAEPADTAELAEAEEAPAPEKQEEAAVSSDDRADDAEDADETEEARASEDDDEKQAQTEARTLIGLGFDALEAADPVQTVYAEFSTGLFVPMLYLSAEGNFTLEPDTFTMPIMRTHYSLTANSLRCTYWDAALSLGVSARMNLGSWHPDLFVSAGAFTNMQLIDDDRYVSTRFEAGLDFPLLWKLTLTVRYSADLDAFSLDSLMDNYRLTAGLSIAFPSFVLF